MWRFVVLLFAIVLFVFFLTFLYAATLVAIIVAFIAALVFGLRSLVDIRKGYLVHYLVAALISAIVLSAGQWFSGIWWFVSFLVLTLLMASVLRNAWKKTPVRVRLRLS